MIYGYLNEILEHIRLHISKEVSRLSNELTSYSNNYTLIENRINDYKITIYNKFYTIISSVINHFYSEVIKKFFNDYIEENLDIYQSNINKENFIEFNYLNIIINLNDIIKEDIKTIINDYKNKSYKIFTSKKYR